MCTAIAKKGKDIIYGFNLDIDPAQWNFNIYKTKDYFTVGITVGKTTYFTHGINKNGNFGNVPYMNGEHFDIEKGAKRQRIDLLNDKYIRNKISYDDVLDIIDTKTVVCIEAVTMHSLIGNSNGDMIIIEPGYGIKKVDDNYAAITNFPALAQLDDYSNPFYGKDRYDRVMEVLSSSNDDFNVNDALKLLSEVKLEGTWGTKVSFVYSKNENSVYYCLNGNFDEVMVHRFI